MDIRNLSKKAVSAAASGLVAKPGRKGLLVRHGQKAAAGSGPRKRAPNIVLYA